VLAKNDDPKKGSARKKQSSKTGFFKRNFVMKTMGGKQLWGDVHFFQGWKIQQNILTKHYRLLDKNDFRHAHGSFKNCLKQLETIKKEKNLPAMKGKVVIVIHGIIRSSKSFSSMRKRLEKENYLVFGFDYPSTRVSIPESAEYLKKSILSLDGVEEIDIVAHSMGGLVVRSYLSKHQDKRIKRMVMMGVPNNGAQMANKLHDNFLYEAIYGPAGQQLVGGKNSFISTLPTPKFEFAIIAGARGNKKGYNPIVPGDDDGTVSVESTRLPGARDFMTFKCVHSFLMGNAEVIDHTIRFLKSGRLRKEGKRKPIPQKPKS